MLPDIPFEWLPLCALYSEIHYRFKALPFSRYFRKQPEILTDAPFRLDPGQSLPILLLSKDADRYPIKIISVKLEASANDKHLSCHIDIANLVINRHWWHHIEWIELPDESPCVWQIEVVWTVEIDGKQKTIRNHNLPGIEPRNLQVRQSGYTLPGADRTVFGDLHIHTAFTEDHIEYGAPLEAYPALGSAAGFGFCLAADHSYDLDDSTDSYLINDPDLVRYRARSGQIERLNAEYPNQFCMLPGYELSVGNSHGKNVHLLMLNQRTFLPGSGDSAEKWFEIQPELSIPDALQRLDQEAQGIAAHPLAKTPLLQKWLLGRGNWEPPDFDDERITGLQIWNGIENGELEAGLKLWVNGLLEGRDWRIFAGSDAHGNFNHHIKVGMPILSLSRMENQRFGEVYTGVQLPAEWSTDDLVDGLRSNPTLITNGPYANLAITSARELLMDALSSPEFGALERIIVFRGDLESKKEEILLQKSPQTAYNWFDKIGVNELTGYFRIEVHTTSGKRAYSNPLWSIDFS